MARAVGGAGAGQPACKLGTFSIFKNFQENGALKKNSQTYCKIFM